MGFTDLVEELKGSTKLTDKSRVLWQYLHDGKDVAFHQYLIREAFDPKILHNVKLTKKDLPSTGNCKLEEVEHDVRIVLSTIATIHSSMENKHRVRDLMQHLRKSDQLALMGVVNKKLRCGVGISTINKVVTDLIPVVKIQLANKYKPEKHTGPCHWYASKKLDGQRIFGIREVEGWKLYSRDKDYLGREITTLEHWKPELEMFYQIWGINFTDGEAYHHGFKFEEIQSLVSSRVNLKDTERLNYHLFMAGKGSLEKQNIIFIPPPSVVGLTDGNKLKHIQAVRQERIVNTTDSIYKYLEYAVVLGYEGIMLRSTDDQGWYDYKRSDLLLKVKTSDTSGTEEIYDCYVEDIEYGDFAVREGGVESIEWLPIRLIVTINSDPMKKKMKVGSGFSLDQRRAWREDETLIVDKTIEVMCQGLGAQGSMRFPRLHRIREDI